MANTSFEIFSWTDEDFITAPKLNAMMSNEQWLRDNMVMGNYTGFKKNKKDGIKIMGGIVQIQKSTTAQRAKQVNFNSFFNPLCKPIVTVTAISSHQRRIMLTVDGIGKPFPDGRGFTVHAFKEGDKPAQRKITRDFYVSWIALGW